MAVDRYREIVAAHRWNVPAQFNIGHACCARWANDRARFALYWEDESGASLAYTFWDLQQRANRLSNALAAMGVGRGDKIALILPQRPETVVAHIATYQLGAVAVPLSFLFGPEALEYRLNDSEAKIAFVDPQSLPNLAPIRDRCPGVAHVIGVAGAAEAWITPYESLARTRRRRVSTPVETHAGDPALLVYTSGTTGPPKGALMPQRCLLGNLPGFVHSHDGYPREGDLFWSPADWAWTGGLMDALLPALYFGQPIVGYRGRFDPERALALMAKYGVRNSFLFPTALKMMMKAVPRPRERFDRRPAHDHERGRSGRHDGVRLGARGARRHDQRNVRPDRDELHRRQFAGAVAGEAGVDGTPVPGAPDRGDRRRRPGGRASARLAKSRSIASRLPASPIPSSSSDYFKNPEGTAKKFTGDWCRTGDLARRDEDGYLWYQGRADDMFKAAGYRIGPSEIENCLVRHPAVANAAVVPSPDEMRGNVVKAFIVLAAGEVPSAAIEDDIRQHVRRYLAPYEYPKEIEFIDALPMTTTGKVQRRVLRERERQRKAAGTGTS